MRPWQCKLCKYSTLEAGSLKKHVDAIHKGLKPYHCKLCEYSAAQASSLRRHVDAIHKWFNPYQCKVCEFFAKEVGISVNFAFIVPQAWCLKNYIDVIHEGLETY